MSAICLIESKKKLLGQVIELSSISWLPFFTKWPVLLCICAVFLCDMFALGSLLFEVEFL